MHSILTMGTFYGVWRSSGAQFSSSPLVLEFARTVQDSALLTNVVDALWLAPPDVELFTALMLLVVGALVTAEMAWGRSAVHIRVVSANFFLCRPVHLRKTSLANKRPASSAKRVVRLRSPKWLEAILAGDTQLKGFFQGVLSAGPGGVVDLLLTRCSLYIGKAMCAQHLIPGLAARFCEHVRSIVRPSSREGARPRYKLFRALGILSLMWFPAAWFASENLSQRSG